MIHLSDAGTHRADILVNVLGCMVRLGRENQLSTAGMRQVATWCLDAFDQAPEQYREDFITLVGESMSVAFVSGSTVPSTPAPASTPWPKFVRNLP